MQTSTSPLVLRGISSMATKAILADLTQVYQAETGVAVQIESVGGVDAAKRVQAGEAFDVVLLASDAIDRLIASGHVLADSRSDWVRSPVAMAVQAGAAHPDIGTEAALKAAVLASPSLGFSTGPSGVYLNQLLARWGIAEQVKPRMVVPPPGTPVGTLVARGEVALGFQQLSELIALPGIEVLGTLPPEVAYITTFSSGIAQVMAHDAARVQAVQAFLKFLASADVEDVKRRQGMDWL
ncbi:extracellular solute-binding protein [Limnohabitans sp. JirII-31]|uniref:substrate-binding domain-containing protein n=1 Tax=Limnohabitans sp. JirII-31 TaxID=1977908 RepID=UPI001E35A17F|nr:substrate-binding domain-containing protein [Limnohabitans sp. JirII-31]